MNAGPDHADPMDSVDPDGESVDDALVDIVRDTPIPKLGGFAVMTRTIEIAQAARARHQSSSSNPNICRRRHNSR